jgi:hypothetical protein
MKMRREWEVRKGKKRVKRAREGAHGSSREEAKAEPHLVVGIYHRIHRRIT